MIKKKWTGNVDKVLAVCGEFSEAFVEVVEKAHSYALCQKPLYSIIANGEEYRSTYRTLDNDLYESLVHSLAYSLVLSSNSHIASFIKAYRDELQEGSITKLGFWKKNPFFWSAFRIHEHYHSSLFDVVDVFTGEKYLLFSPEVEEIVIQCMGDYPIVYSTVFANGECFQTGKEVSYTFLSVQNLAFVLTHCSTHNTKAVTKEVVSKAVYRNYFLFSLIEFIRDRDNHTIEGYELKYCYSIHHLTSEASSIFSSSKHLMNLGFTKAREVYELFSVKKSVLNRYVAKFPHGDAIVDDMHTQIKALLRPTLYYKKSEQAVMIEAMSVEGYQLMRLFVESLLTLPIGESNHLDYQPAIQDPLTHEYSDVITLSPNLFDLLDASSFYKDLPTVSFSGYRGMKRKRVAKNSYYRPGKKELFEKYVYIQECVALAFYEGTRIDIDAIANEVGISREEIEKVEQVSIKSLEDDENSIIYHYINENPLKNIPIFTPQFKQRLQVPLRYNDLFCIISKYHRQKGAEALGLLNRDGNRSLKIYVEESDFVDALEELANEDFYGDASPLILNTILYIMSKNAGKWVSIFAISLKIALSFEVSLKSNHYTVDQVIKEIHEFIIHTLTSVGLVEVRVSDEGERQVRTTDFFSFIISLAT